MKLAVFSILILLPFLISANEKYSSKYDNIDLDQILESDRLLNNYVNCLLERGKCTRDAAELKKYLPDALENDCAKCTERQSEGTSKVIHFLMDNKPDIWIELEDMYDPEHKYLQKYKSKAAETL